MFEAPQFTINITGLDLSLVVKVVALTMILLYAIISFFVYNKILALNRIVFFPPRTAANSIKTVALTYFLLVLSLFLLTLVIV